MLRDSSWLEVLYAKQTVICSYYVQYSIFEHGSSFKSMPPISKGSSNTFFERSFIYAAPTEWNKLDGRIRKITNFDSFKREIKTTLFLSYFDL